MQIQPHKENDHGQRTTTQEQGSEEAEEEADSGDLRISNSGPVAAAGGSRPKPDGQDTSPLQPLNFKFTLSCLFYPSLL
jgi:hypothetical protein